MKYSHRFFLYAPVAAVLALSAAVSIYWFAASGAFAKRLDALNGHEIAPGVSLHFASRSIGGFPFRIDAVLENMRLDIAAAHGPASWQAEHFALHMLDYGRQQFVFEAAGRQRLVWHDDQGAVHDLSFTPALLRASAIAKAGRLQRFDIELYDAATRLVGVSHSEFHLRRDPDRDALDIVFMADDVHLAPSLQGALGQNIARLRLKAALAPGKAWNGFLAGRGGWRRAAEDWRNRSGTLDIATLDVAWGKSEASGQGVLRLDAAHRPEGLLKLKITGAQALAGEAARRHLVQAAQMGVLAGLMAEAAQKAKEPTDSLPVILAFKDGIAYVDETPAAFLDPLY